jgi:hypothetical protein
MKLISFARSHFGAEVIKVEPPVLGDPLRVWRELDIDGTSPWFRSLGRNKKVPSLRHFYAIFKLLIRPIECDDRSAAERRSRVSLEDQPGHTTF